MSKYRTKRRGMERSVLIVNDAKTTVAEVFTDREPGDQYDVAALFAAAPEMLAALRMVRAYMRRGPVDSGSEAYDAIVDAICRATDSQG